MKRTAAVLLLAISIAAFPLPEDGLSELDDQTINGVIAVRDGHGPQLNEGSTHINALNVRQFDIGSVFGGLFGGQGPKNPSPPLFGGGFTSTNTPGLPAGDPYVITLPASPPPADGISSTNSPGLPAGDPYVLTLPGSSPQPTAAAQPPARDVPKSGTPARSPPVDELGFSKSVAASTLTPASPKEAGPEVAPNGSSNLEGLPGPKPAEDKFEPYNPNATPPKPEAEVVEAPEDTGSNTWGPIAWEPLTAKPEPVTPAPPAAAPPIPQPPQPQPQPSLPAPQTSLSTAALYGQCGGRNWNGATSCAPGSSCKALNEWYHQCVPNANAEKGRSDPQGTYQSSSPTSPQSSIPKQGGEMDKPNDMNPADSSPKAIPQSESEISSSGPFHVLKKKKDEKKVTEIERAEIDEAEF
ncbi:Cellulose-binding protein [Venturia nashicola]|uniref:Cellulose-binding protein n=1 Tax=Venturia nashicola TaxID=86259 RepID=A0A4Z1NUM4_9PEZI|nr:Cellulose-binding protein [Venturia nashicola]TLD20218.1 Cellulose-binding protein [Venturia nashicola]